MSFFDVLLLSAVYFDIIHLLFTDSRVHMLRFSLHRTHTLHHIAPKTPVTINVPGLAKVA
jgi:hypothetical protein